MGHVLVIANIERAADHAAVFGLVAAVVAVVALLYGLVRLAGRRRGDGERDA